jgi:HlyD family secretion protein
MPEGYRQTPMNRRVLLSLVAVAAVAAIVIWRRSGSTEEAPRYRTTAVESGDLIVSVTASGTLQPVTQVQVGTQVSGTIQSLFADFNSTVKQGEVVAQLDPASYEAHVESDKANLIRAEADVTRVQALLKQAENEARRMTDLVSTNLVTASEYDAAIANRDSLLAQVKVADATVKQQKAALAVSQVNLTYCTIKSPIDGIVVARSVDVGQTVAASLSAPTIFVIAADLEKMQVQAAVTEADIGRLKNGVPVSFNVDAYPGETFHGNVSQVRLAPTTVQNVVTYTVLVDAANPGGRLLPGMTADLVFELDRHDNVLLVPDSALRFTPEDKQEKGFGGKSGDGTLASAGGGSESSKHAHGGRSSKGDSKGKHDDATHADAAQKDAAHADAATGAAPADAAPAGAAPANAMHGDAGKTPVGATHAEGAVADAAHAGAPGAAAPDGAPAEGSPADGTHGGTHGTHGSHAHGESAHDGSSAGATIAVDRADGAVETASLANEPPPAQPVEHPGRVWLSTPDGPQPVDVTVAESDGLRSAIVGGPLKEGDEIITGVLAAPGATTATNPFAPTMGRPGGTGGGGRGR